jgi:hypothetical protein
MSNAKLKQATRFIVERATQKKQTKKKQKDSQARSDAEKFPGQMLVLNREHQAALIYQEFGIRLSKEERKEMFALIDVFMKAKESKLKFGSEEERMAAMALKPSFKKKSGDFVYVVSNFEAAKRFKFKTRNPDDVSKIQARYVNSLGKSNRKVTAQEISALSQLGHGDRGVSASQFGVDRAIAEAGEKFNLSGAELEQLKAIATSARIKHNMEINYAHDQIFDNKGQFKKDFTFVISSQSTLQNKADRDIETAAFVETLEGMDILGMETSTLAEEAIAQVTLHNLANKKRQNKKVTGKRKRKVAEKASGKIEQKREERTAIAYTAQRGLATKGIKRRKQGRSRGVASQPLNLMAMLNKELPDTVRKNMVAPALENRTGTFADSVKVTDVMQTAKGFPSVGYTYKRNPYQVFEVGPGDARWATPERDPRKLIDRSIREIAAEFAIGRFYTRRI